MEIYYFHFKHWITFTLNDGWVGEMELNNINGSFTFRIEEDEIIFIVLDENNEYSQEEAYRIFKEASEHPEIKKSFDYMKNGIKGFQKIERLAMKKNISLNLTDSHFNGRYEYYNFTFPDIEIEMKYILFEDKINDCSASFSLTNTNQSHFPRFAYISNYFSAEFHKRIIEILQKHPKVRLRKLFK